jgi:MFS family permease
MALMFQNNGLSEIQISTLLILWAVFVMVFQPIVGGLGDRYSRKIILLCGQLCKAVAFVLFLMIPNFWGYLLGFAFWGIQWAIEASVCDAFVYDELKCMKAANKYVSVSGKMLAFLNAGLLVSTVGSFIVAEHGYDYVIVITIIAMLLSVFSVASIKMIQPKSYRKSNHNSWIDSVWRGAKAVLGIKYLLPTMIILSCVIAIADLDDYIGLLGNEIGISLRYID